MEHLAGSLTRIIYRGTDGRVVAELAAEQNAPVCVVVGALGDAEIGDELQVSGVWEEHPRFGRQFKVSAAERRQPSSEQGLLRYLAAGAVPGVGPALAQRLVAHLGSDLLAIAASDPQRRGFQRRL